MSGISAVQFRPLIDISAAPVRTNHNGKIKVKHDCRLFAKTWYAPPVRAARTAYDFKKAVQLWVCSLRLSLD